MPVFWTASARSRGWPSWYLSYAPPDGQVWHKTFLKVGPDTRHSSKEWCLRRQAISLTPPMRVKTWGVNYPTRMPDSVLNILCTKQWLAKLPKLFLVRYSYRLSLTLILIRQIKLPVSLQYNNKNVDYSSNTLNDKIIKLHLKCFDGKYIW